MIQFAGHSVLCSINFLGSIYAQRMTKFAQLASSMVMCTPSAKATGISSTHQ
jgi:hypothetical protein